MKKQKQQPQHKQQQQQQPQPQQVHTTCNRRVIIRIIIVPIVASIVVVTLLLFASSSSSTSQQTTKKEPIEYYYNIEQQQEGKSIQQQQQQQQQQRRRQLQKKTSSNNNKKSLLSTLVQDVVGDIISTENTSMSKVKEIEQSSLSTTRTQPIPNNNNNNNKDYTLLVEEMKQRLLPPKELKVVTDNNNNINNENATRILQPQQFLHMHHMKTGGTSIDQLIDCSIHRLQNNNDNSNNNNYIVPYYNLHECEENMYAKCKNTNNDNNNKIGQQCRTSVQNAAIISYCAPIKDLQYPFGWNYTTTSTTVDSSKESILTSSTNNNMNNYNKTFHSITILRHPIARAWSMYRFRTNDCYACMTLKDIYNMYDNATDDDDDYIDDDFIDLCYEQLTNHQTKNILGYDMKQLQLIGMTDDEIIQLAIQQMKSFFTIVGITEDITTTAKMIGIVFPWLNETTYHNSDMKCTLQHANASPKNNHCGPNNSHMPLPDYPPDDETIQLILQHNQLDLKLYEAAVEQFHIQKLALNL